MRAIEERRAKEVAALQAWPATQRPLPNSVPTPWQCHEPQTLLMP